MARLNNGKLIDGRYHRGEDILNEIPEGRRAVHIYGKVVKNLDPRKNYSPEDIKRVRIMPDRSKGEDEGEGGLAGFFLSVALVVIGWFVLGSDSKDKRKNTSSYSSEPVSSYSSEPVLSYSSEPVLSYSSEPVSSYSSEPSSSYSSPYFYKSDRKDNIPNANKYR